MLHGGTLNKVRNLEALFERVGNKVLAQIDPIETERIVALSQSVHDNLNNYALASDFKSLIDLYPQANRTNADQAARRFAEPFDLLKALTNKTISIESNEGTKFLRINWKWRAAKTLHNMDSLTANGTWSLVGSATGLSANTIYKYSGGASIEFDLVASGDGIQNTSITALDLTTEDEKADIIIPIYFSATPTSVTVIWGNDLTTNYWTSVTQTTQADGTAFRVGWNLVKFPWSTATETGTVASATIDSFKLTVAAGSAISNIRVDNIIFSLGQPFDSKYYSQYIFKNTSGTWISRPTSDDDTMVLQGTAAEIYLRECVIAAAQQIEGEDSANDINWATAELKELYPRYRGEHPSQSKKAVTNYFGAPRFKN